MIKVLKTMIFIKYILIFFIFAISIIIGNSYSKKYSVREKELKEILNILNVIKAKMTLAKEENKSCYIEVNSPQTILMPEVFLNTGDNILQYGNNYMYIRKEDYRYANINN